MKKIAVLLFLTACFSSFAFKLNLNLKKGERFIYTVKKNQAMVMGNKLTAYRNETEINLIFDVQVVEWKEDHFTISFLLKKGTLSIVSPLGANKFDTEINKKYPDNPFLAMLIEMKSTPLLYTFGRKDLKVKKIEGVSTLEKKIIHNLNFKDTTLKKRVADILKKKTEEMEKGYGFDFNLFPYLNREVEEGKEFKVKQLFYKGEANIKADVVYSVDKITDNSVFFKIDSSFNMPEKETNFNGLKALLSVRGKQTGNLTVNRDTGLASFYSVEQVVDGVFVIKDTKERFPVKVNSVIILRFKRVN